MFQFNLRLDPEIIEDLNLNEDTVIEAYFDTPPVSLTRPLVSDCILHNTQRLYKLLCGKRILQESQL